MSSILEYMSSRHGDCDRLFADAEQCIVDGNWDEARAAFDQFFGATGRHFAMEEEVLFPALESGGQTGGPTQVMRMEHQQMRDLFEDLAKLIEGSERDEVLGATETLLVLMQQHNMKEEQILYPMADRFLGARAGEVIAAMESRE